jgi:S-adenosyl-L-methionine hydrolase (adenosine-forming)
MPLRYDTLTFASDYGRVDEFVGVVHSVVRAISPDITVVDLTHDIAAHDTRAAGLLLARSVQYLCPGVVLAVVDPGVGGGRRGVAVEVGDGASVLVGPDNGLLAPAVAMCGGATRAVELTNTDYQFESPGPTFAGRDVFAPAAAYLCTGVALTDLGNEVDPATLLPGVLPVSHVDDEGDLVAEVLWVDRFGNAQLNVDPLEVDALVGDDGSVELAFGGITRAASRAVTYEAVGAGAIGLVVDSYGLVAVVADRSSAAGDLGLAAGTEIRLRALSDGNADVEGSVGGVSVNIGEPRRRP